MSSAAIEERKSATNHSLINYEMLAALFTYPAGELYREKIKNIYLYLLRQLPASAEILHPFHHFVESSSLQEIQELFLRSFDLQAITTLDIGFILFGEDYKRGQLLVHLNKEHSNAGNLCHTELADHLPNILCLLPKMKDETMRDEIAVRLLLPAVVKMVGEFSAIKIEKKDVVYKKHQKVLLEYSPNNRTVYQYCLQALFIALKNDFGYDYTRDEFSTVNSDKEKITSSYNEKPGSCSLSKGHADFTQSIETELNIEKD